MHARRIVLFGPPLGGKTTMLTAYARSRDVDVERIECAFGPEAMPHWVLRASLPDATEIATIPGSPWGLDGWRMLISRASAVVLVLDSQASREEADREHLSELTSSARCPPVGCIVWTKEDLIAAGVCERVSPSILDVPSDERLWRDPSPRSNAALIAGWPQFATRMDDRTSVLAPLEHVVRSLRR